MNPTTKKQWLWFAGLWCVGFLTVLAISSVIKLLFYFMTL